MLYFYRFTAVCGTGYCWVDGLAGYSSSHHMWDLGLIRLRRTSVSTKTSENGLSKSDCEIFAGDIP